MIDLTSIELPDHHPMVQELISVIKGINVESIPRGSYEDTLWWLITLCFLFIPVFLIIALVFDTIPFLWVLLWVIIMLVANIVVEKFIMTFSTILGNDIRWVLFLWVTFVIRIIKRYIFIIDPISTDLY